MIRARRQPRGMAAFTLIALGQLVSLLGTGMTRFAITIYAWQLTGEATALALVGFFAFGPTVLLSPVAGAIVDRANRKLVMMLSDMAAGLMTLTILLLYLSGELQIWHLYLTGALSGAFESFQFPAYSAAVTTMLSKEQYARANGMLSLVDSASAVAAPILAGTLIGLIGIGGILTIDLITFGLALLALLLVFVPQPERSEAGRQGQGNLWSESAYGFKYILRRPSLLLLQLIFTGINFTGTFMWVLMAPMILARTGDQEVVLGSVQSMLGIGGVAGALVLSAWGGPRRRIHGVLLGMALSSLLGAGVMGLGRGVVLWSIAAFADAFFVPFINGSNQAIWQSKVAPDVQGRVFAVRRLIAQVTAPLAMLLAGPLADRIFEPAMLPGGALAGSLGRLVGTGPGAGMALIMLTTAVLGVAVGLAGYLIPGIREVERLLPDHDAMPMPAAAAA